jgi:hypothetical protein
VALSNWDTLAFNAKGQASPGEVENRHGVTLEIYKNWLYVRDPKTWKEGRQYTKPVIAEIGEGTIQIGGFDIVAKRCGQNGVMVVAGYHSAKYKRHYFFGGIGCSGYKNEIPEICARLGLDPTLEWGEMSTSHLDEATGKWMHDEYLCRWVEDGKNTHSQEYLFKSVPEDENEWAEWIGVTQETLNEFFEFAESLEDNHFYNSEYKDWLKKIRKAEALRYNQGDMFFAANLQNDEILGATPVGEPGKPVIEDMIKNMTPEQASEMPLAQALDKILEPGEQGSGVTISEVAKETE